MTYCVGIEVNAGLVVVSDSRTNAGVDHVSTYSKMWQYGVPGERQFIICSAGNLATTQAVIAAVERDIAAATAINLMNVSHVSEAAAYLGGLSVAAQHRNTGGGPTFESTFLLAGEIAGADRGLYLVYAAGNYIRATPQTPYLQIGETKYGKPILDRVIFADTDLQQASLCALVSMDATMRSNLTVGPPIERLVYPYDSLQPGEYQQYGEDSEYLRSLHRTWDNMIKSAFENLQGMQLGSVDQLQA